MSALAELADDQTTRWDGLVEAAAKLAPKLSARAEAAEGLGRLPDETIDDLDSAELTKLAIPAAYGGQQAPPLVNLRVMEELARGCASTSFVNLSYFASAWLTCLLPDEAHRDVFTSDNSRGIVAINPAGGTATPKGEDFVLSGRWPFCSGQHHAGWALMFAMIPKPDGVPGVGMFLAPRSEFRSANDWQVTGMAATGSDSLIADEMVVPAHRVLLLEDMMSGQFASTLVRDEPYYRGSILPFTLAAFGGTPLGLGEAAMDLFEERIGRRGITYTTYLRQADAAVTHLQMAEARMKLDEARFHGMRIVQSAESGTEKLDLLGQARCRADVTWDIRLCREAIDIIHAASGAQAIHRKDPLQRIARDIHALSVHSLFLPTTVAELYGRILCGLDPGVPLV